MPTAQASSRSKPSRKPERGTAIFLSIPMPARPFIFLASMVRIPFPTRARLGEGAGVAAPAAAPAGERAAGPGQRVARADAAAALAEAAAALAEAAVTRAEAAAGVAVVVLAEAAAVRAEPAQPPAEVAAPSGAAVALAEAPAARAEPAQVLGEAQEAAQEAAVLLAEAVPLAGPRREGPGQARAAAALRRVVPPAEALAPGLAVPLRLAEERRAAIPQAAEAALP